MPRPIRCIHQAGGRLQGRGREGILVSLRWLHGGAGDDARERDAAGSRGADADEYTWTQLSASGNWYVGTVVNRFVEPGNPTPFPRRRWTPTGT